MSDKDTERQNTLNAARKVMRNRLTKYAAQLADEQSNMTGIPIEELHYAMARILVSGGVMKIAEAGDQAARDDLREIYLRVQRYIHEQLELEDVTEGLPGLVENELCQYQATSADAVSLMTDKLTAILSQVKGGMSPDERLDMLGSWAAVASLMAAVKMHEDGHEKAPDCDCVEINRAIGMALATRGLIVAADAAGLSVVQANKFLQDVTRFASSKLAAK